MNRDKLKEATSILKETLAVTEPYEETRTEKIKKLLAELKSEVLEHGFTDKQEEMAFFKKSKPYFCGHLMFAYNTQKIRLDSPDWSETFLQQFYQSKLTEINTFFDGNKEMVSYYRSKDSHLDELLFVRDRTSCPTWLCTQRVDIDERFSTLGDYTFSQIVANELTAKYITELIKGNGNGTNHNDEPPLQWTGDTINLIELAYGIHSTGQINNGQAGIMDIIRALAVPFNVEVKRPYRRFNEIRQRKRLSRTQYIDSMGSALNKKLEDEEAYRP